MFQFHKTKRTSRRLKYHHGAGGDAPVTKGTIQTNRQAVYLPDADIVVNGHSHNAYVLPLARERLNDKGVVTRDLCYFIRTPGYKDDYGDGSGGFAIETWKPPKPLGSVWIRFYLNKHQIETEVIPAIK